MKIEVIKDLEIKKPKSPSSWVGEPKYLPITRLKMSLFLHGRVVQIKSSKKQPKNIFR